MTEQEYGSNWLRQLPHLLSIQRSNSSQQGLILHSQLRNKNNSRTKRQISRNGELPNNAKSGLTEYESLNEENDICFVEKLVKLKGTRTRDFDRIGFTHLELSTILFNSILVINQKSNIKLSDHTITTGNSRSFQVLKNQAYYTVTELTKNLSDHLFINTKKAKPELIQSELGIQLDLLVYKPNSNIYCLLSDQDKILTKTQCKLIIDAIQSELEYEDSQVLQTNISQTEIRSLFVTQDQLTLDPPEVVISGKFPFYSNLKQQKLIRNLRKILHLSSKLTNLFHSNLLHRFYKFIVYRLSTSFN